MYVYTVYMIPIRDEKRNFILELCQISLLALPKASTLQIQCQAAALLPHAKEKCSCQRGIHASEDGAPNFWPDFMKGKKGHHCLVMGICFEVWKNYHWNLALAHVHMNPFLCKHPFNSLQGTNWDSGELLAFAGPQS